MSTLKATNLSHASAASPNIVLDSAGKVTFGGAVAGAGLDLVTPTSVAGTGVTLSGGKVTFTAATTISVNGCFTATYDNYLIYVNGVSSGSNYLQGRLRVAGVDAVGASDYLSQYITNGSYGADAATSAWVRAAAFETTTPNNSVITLFSPFLAERTGWQFSLRNPIPWVSMGGGSHLLSTSYDGLTLFLASGNATGTLRVYGLRNS